MKTDAEIRARLEDVQQFLRDAEEGMIPGLTQSDIVVAGIAVGVGGVRCSPTTKTIT